MRITHLNNKKVRQNLIIQMGYIFLSYTDIFLILFDYIGQHKLGIFPKIIFGFPSKISKCSFYTQDNVFNLITEHGF